MVFFLISTSIAQSGISKEEYEVYGSQFHQLILNQTSVRGLEYKRTWLNKWLPSRLKKKGILTDFLSKNTSTSPIEYQLKTQHSYKLLSRDKINEAFNLNQGISSKDDEKNWDGQEKRWENFYKIYPKSGGYAIFSRVGFSDDKTWALFSVERFYGWLGADGYFYLLKKTGNNWKVQKKTLSWIS